MSAKIHDGLTKWQRWYQKLQQNPEKYARHTTRDAAAHHRWSLRTLYGITEEEYERLKYAQGGVCAICRGPETNPRKKALSVDHDHVSGKVRGLLCHRCNIGLGIFADSPLLLNAAARYVGRTG